MKVGIFTVCIGEKYIQEYETNFKHSVLEYCNIYNYDLNIITEFLGNQEFHNHSFISFTKMMIPYSEKAKEYDLIMVLDADIIVNKNSPPFHIIDFNNKIGVVDEYTQPNYSERLNIQKNNGWEVGASEYYKLCNLDIDTKMMINSGMFICNPKIHSLFFENLVKKYINNQLNHPRGFHYEQSVFGYELQKQQLYYIMNNEWNRIWFLYKNIDNQISILDKFINIYRNSYFLHLTGNCDRHLLQFLDLIE